MTNKFAHIESGHKDKDGSHVCFGCCYCTNRQRRIACTCLWGPIVLLICFIIAILIKTAFVEDRFERKTLTTDEPVFINPDSALKVEWATRLGQAIQIKTISFNETTMSLDELKLLQDFIVEKYPAIHAAEFIKKTIVNEHSLIYRIEGSIHTKNPYLLCAHLDVVPEGKTESWSHDPFLGEIVHDDETDLDYIFGRGAIDDKQAVFGILEALEHLVSQGEQPKRTFYIAFGHDEELSGFQGAKNIAVELEKFFTDNNEKLDFMLDEGMFVMKDVFPGVTDPVVYVGVVEKGWAIVEVSVSGVQGHASKPPRESAIGILANAIAKLEENRQPSMFGKSVEIDTFEYIAPHTNFLYKMILGNLWLFSGLLSSIISGDPATDAIQRTTTAITLIDAGIKVNVIPSEAKAFINYRVHPAETIDDVIKEARDVIGDDRVSVEVVESFVPSVVTDYSLEAIPFQIVVNSALEVYPEGHVTPGIMIANTDTRHYQHLSDNTFRFSPTFLQKNDLDRFHGLDERISVDNYAQVVEFYYRLMKNADYDIKEKSDIEVLDAFEGSGVTGPEEESENDVIVDQNFNEPVEGSSEL